MKTKNFLVLLVAVFALAILAVSNASAANFDRIGINEQLETDDNRITQVFAGETIKVSTVVTMGADEQIWNARITARLIGQSGTLVESKEFVAVKGKTYSQTLFLKVPFDLDPSQQRFTLLVTIEGTDAGEAGRKEISLVVQRESYQLEVLAFDAMNEVKAGENLALDVVLQNRGYLKAENAYLRATIPELGISKTVFYGDLYPTDKSGDNEEDAVERRMFLSIPSNAAEGLYTLELEAFNDDSSTLTSKKIFVTSAAEDSRVVSSSSSKTFAVGEETIYTMTLVNAGNSIKIYDLVVDSDSGLNVELDESVVAVPAGSSRTVQMRVTASENGRQDFTVNIRSDNQIVDSAEFTANVEGTRNIAGNAAVLLTVVLAVVFLVLLIVLIVLLTRKPEKTENFGESYY